MSDADATNFHPADMHRRALVDRLQLEATYLFSFEVKCISDPNHDYWSGLLREAIAQVKLDRARSAIVYLDCQELEKRKRDRNTRCLPAHEVAMIYPYLIEQLGGMTPSRNRYCWSSRYSDLITALLNRNSSTVLIIDSAHLLFPSTIRLLACDTKYWSEGIPMTPEGKIRRIGIATIFVGDSTLKQKQSQADLSSDYRMIDCFDSWPEFYESF